MYNKLKKSEFTIVTTFSEDGWNKYGHRFAKSMDQYLPQNIKVLLYYEGTKPSIKFTDRMHFLDFNKYCGKKQNRFKEIAKQFEHDVFLNRPNEAEFKFQASRFSHKYYACEHAVKNITSRYLVWVDADVIALKTIPEIFFYKLVLSGAYWSRISRGQEYPECGFMVWDRQHNIHKVFWKVMKTMYDDGQLFKLPEWHDSYVWWEAEKTLQNKFDSMITFDLGDGEHGHAFIRGVLGEYFDHLKGERKIFGFSPEKETILHKFFYFVLISILRIFKKLKKLMFKKL